MSGCRSVTAAQRPTGATALPRNVRRVRRAFSPQLGGNASGFCPQRGAPEQRFRRTFDCAVHDRRPWPRTATPSAADRPPHFRQNRQPRGRHRRTGPKKSGEVPAPGLGPRPRPALVLVIRARNGELFPRRREFFGFLRPRRLSRQAGTNPHFGAGWAKPAGRPRRSHATHGRGNGQQWKIKQAKHLKRAA